MLFAAWYSMVIGVAMIAQWAFSLSRKAVPEIKSEPVRIAFHLVGEFVTAVALITGGAGLLAGAGWGRTVSLLALGMLLYTALVSPGYFGQRGQWNAVALFAGITALTLVAAGLLIVRE